MKLLEKVRGNGERLFMLPISTEGQSFLSKNDRISTLEPYIRLLISEGFPIVIEHAAYSFDPKKKRGQVALLLAYRFTPAGQNNE